jgi:hypothetical protein
MRRGPVVNDVAYEQYIARPGMTVVAVSLFPMFSLSSSEGPGVKRVRPRDLKPRSLSQDGS